VAGEALLCVPLGGSVLWCFQDFNPFTLGFGWVCRRVGSEHAMLPVDRAPTDASDARNHAAPTTGTGHRFKSRATGYSGAGGVC
jgi:hypothetical protein